MSTELSTVSHVDSVKEALPSAGNAPLSHAAGPGSLSQSISGSVDGSTPTSIPESSSVPGPILAPKIVLSRDSDSPARDDASLDRPASEIPKRDTPATPASVPATPASIPVSGQNPPLQPLSNPAHNSSPSLPQSALPQPSNLTAYHPNAKNTTTVNTNGTTTTKLNTASPVCRNCKTQTTPLWRRDETGQVLCNACGLFLKLHGRPRPISLKTDTIKSRNRVKQPLVHPGASLSQPGLAGASPGPHSAKLPSPDPRSRKDLKLPKLKKSDPDHHAHGMGQTGSENGDFTSSRSLNLTPLLPAVGRTHGGSHHLHNINSPHANITQPSMHPSLPSYLNGHHVVQPLHYPSSTPTQFAPGLQRITSPLLLLTVSNARLERGSLLLLSKDQHSHHSAALSAAGALETMAHELGPSATFRPGVKGSGSGRGTGVLLLGQDQSKTNSVERNPVFSAMNAHPAPPKLPALGHSHLLRNSPAFGAQFGNDLPPLQAFLSAQPISQGLADEQGQGAHTNNDPTRNNQPPPNSNSNHPGRDGDRSNQDNGQNNNQNPGGDNTNGLETTLLKTRISELELVNDLYRTRIMELEAMEQAARLRESSMRRRLDEVLILNGYSAVPSDLTNVANSSLAGRLAGHGVPENAFPPRQYTTYAQPALSKDNSAGETVPSSFGGALGKRPIENDAAFGDSKRAK